MFGQRDDKSSCFGFVYFFYTEIFLLFRCRYCPNAETEIKCFDICLPIYNECYSAEEVKGIEVFRETFQHFYGFFCKNGSEAVTSFIDGNMVDCCMKKKFELKKCLKDFQKDYLEYDKENPLFQLLPKANYVCK